MGFMHSTHYAIAQVLATCFWLVTQPAAANIVDDNFNADLQTGVLAGTSFSGSFSYDNSGMTGIGVEFFTLGTLDFTLLGVSFNRAEVSQGGQAVIQYGIFSYFTAAYFPPPPAASPVSDIAFGFGGPGVIGYIAPPGSHEFGLGSYNVQIRSADELSALGYFASWIVVLVCCGASPMISRRFGRRP